MKRQARANAGIIFTQLLAEIDAFLEARPTRGELAADGKITAPRASTTSHFDATFRGDVLREEGAAQREQAFDRAGTHAMTGDVKETKLACCPVHLGGNM